MPFKGGGTDVGAKESERTGGKPTRREEVLHGESDRGGSVRKGHSEQAGGQAAAEPALGGVDPI